MPEKRIDINNVQNDPDDRENEIVDGRVIFQTFPHRRCQMMLVVVVHREQVID